MNNIHTVCSVTGQMMTDISSMGGWTPQRDVLGVIQRKDECTYQDHAINILWHIKTLWALSFTVYMQNELGAASLWQHMRDLFDLL